MKKTNESGRSMVEMLGVLAIIGILSVSGIIGYTLAMRKYKANEIGQAIAMLAVEAKTRNMGDGITGSITYANTFGHDNPSGVNSQNDQFNANHSQISVRINDMELCKAVNSLINGGPFTSGDCDASSDDTAIFTVSY